MPVTGMIDEKGRSHDVNSLELTAIAPAEDEEHGRCARKPDKCTLLRSRAFGERRDGRVAAWRDGGGNRDGVTVGLRGIVASFDVHGAFES